MISVYCRCLLSYSWRDAGTDYSITCNDIYLYRKVSARKIPGANHVAYTVIYSVQGEWLKNAGGNFFNKYFIDLGKERDIKLDKILF